MEDKIRVLLTEEVVNEKIKQIGEQVSKEEVNNSYYQMTPNKYKVGVKTSNAEASSAMYTAIANNDLNQVYVVLNQYGG